MKLKDLDIKTIFIIILSLGLIVSFTIGQKKGIDYKKDEIKNLQEKNISLVKENSKILFKNKELDNKIFLLRNEIKINKELLTKTESQLNNLKQRRNEISNRVTNLSTNDVANELSDYIQRHVNDSIR